MFTFSSAALFFKPEFAAHLFQGELPKFFVLEFRAAG